MKRLFCAIGLFVFLFSSFGTLLGVGSSDLIVNHIVSHPEIESYIYITDVEGKGPEVTVTFYSEDGRYLGETRVVLNPYGNATVQPFKVLNKVAVGTARIKAVGGTVVSEYWQLVNRPKAGEQYSVAVPAQPSSGHDYLVLQHYVSHPDIGSHLFLSDTQGNGPTVKIQFMDEEGNLIKEERVLIPQNGTLDIDPYEKLKRIQVGTARITSEGDPIVGEYWQIVNRKYTKEEREVSRDVPKREHYAVAIPLRGKINTTLDVNETTYNVEFITEVHFDVDKWEVRDVDKPAIQEAARVIQSFYKDKDIIIEGHTDESGEDDYNLKLSQRRAESVRNYLIIEYGLDSTKLLAIGKGEREPLVAGMTGEAGQVNRRVVFKVNK